jgi:hypothetical protein
VAITGCPFSLSFFVVQSSFGLREKLIHQVVIQIKKFTHG